MLARLARTTVLLGASWRVAALSLTVVPARSIAGGLALRGRVISTATGLLWNCASNVRSTVPSDLLVALTLVSLSMVTSGILLMVAVTMVSVSFFGV